MVHFFSNQCKYSELGGTPGSCRPVPGTASTWYIVAYVSYDSSSCTGSTGPSTTVVLEHSEYEHTPEYDYSTPGMNTCTHTPEYNCTTHKHGLMTEIEQ